MADIENVCRFINSKMSHVWGICVFISIANFKTDVDIFVDIMSVKIEEYFIFGNELKD